MEYSKCNDCGKELSYSWHFGNWYCPNCFKNYGYGKNPVQILQEENNSLKQKLNKIY